jgi:copper chaperone CopZ
MSELTLYVAGMGCRRCVREVTARLRDVSGVQTVAADAGKSHVQLTGSMTFPDVVRALVGTTYRAEVVQDVVQGVGENRGRTGTGQDIP